MSKQPFVISKEELNSNDRFFWLSSRRFDLFNLHTSININWLSVVKFMVI